jgi:predicted PurR-regulated permease PerM
LVPMVIWHFWIGQPVRAVMLALLYVFIVVVRQVVEPRLLSHNLGIHPIVAIISVFLGLQLFGPIGLIILPLTASIAGSFPRFRWLRR